MNTKHLSPQSQHILCETEEELTVRITVSGHDTAVYIVPSCQLLFVFFFYLQFESY